MRSPTHPARGRWRDSSRIEAPKFVTIAPVLETNEEGLQEGPQAVAGSQAPGKGSVEQLYLEQLETITKLAAYACRRYGFGHEDVEDFTQDVLAKILADDYAVLRKFQGRSNLASYLAVVVQRALLDDLNKRWGKWRPSKAAWRQGRLAVALETLMVRDRLSFDVACRTLRSRGETTTDAELSEIADRLPSLRRIGGHRGSAGGTASGDLRDGVAPGREPVADESADDGIRASELQQRRQQVEQSLAGALATLPAEDCLIAKMVGGGFKVVEIAAHLKLDRKEQKQLYKRTKQILERLREILESAGVSAADVEDILGDVDS